ncbi:MAG: C40 family peptidase, partial [Peptostreptococcaceae bacterium]
PYVWGAEGPNSFDCSGLTSYVYKNAAGVTLPRTSSAQSGFGKTVSKSELQPGDLVFSGNGSVSHVGIYVGGGNMVHSPKPGDTVQVTSINSSYYANRFITAKRVL